MSAFRLVRKAYALEEKGMALRSLAYEYRDVMPTRAVLFARVAAYHLNRATELFRQAADALEGGK